MEVESYSESIRRLALSTTASCSDSELQCDGMNTEQHISGLGRRSMIEASTGDEELIRGGY